METSCFNRNIETNNHAPCWDKQCELLKNNKYRHLRRFRKSDNEHDYIEYIIARNKFKAVCRKYQIHFHQQQRLTLINSESNPEEFWRHGNTILKHFYMMKKLHHYLLKKKQII